MNRKDDARQSIPAGLKHTEDALRETEEKHRTLIENVNIGVFRSTYDGTFLQINPALAKMLGHKSVEELMSTHTSAVLCDKQAIEDFLRLIRNKDGIRNKEMQLRRVDGSRILTSITAKARFGDNGKVVWIDGVIEDITESRAVEELYRTLSEKSFAGLYVLQDGVFKYINPNAAASTEFSPAEIVGGSSQSIVHPNDWEKVKKVSRNMLKGRRTYPYTYRIVTKYGKTRTIMETVSSIVYRGRRAIMGNSMDVTERFAAEERVRESQQQLASVIEFLPDATLVIDKDGTVLAWNKEIENMTGVKAEAMVGKGNYEYALPFYGSRRPILADLVLTPHAESENGYTFLANEQNLLVVETNAPMVKGEKRILWAKAAPIYNTRGEITGSIETIRDVTERKRLEKQLQRSEELYRTIFENAAAATIIVGEDTRIILANSVFEELIGFKKDEIENKMSWTEFVAGKDIEKMMSYHVDRRASGNAPRVYEFCFRDRQGREKAAEMHITLIPGTNNSLASIIDMTDRKKAEHDLLEKEVRLKQVEKMESLGLLAGGVAHDLNNVFSGLVGYPEIVLMQLNLVKDNPDPEKINKFLNDLPKKMSSILKSAQMASDIVQDLLAMARRGVMEDKTLNLNDIIWEYLNSAKFHMVEGFYPRIKLETDLDKTLLNMDGSRTHLMKTIMNLLGNAFEAIPEGKAGEIRLSTYNLHIDHGLPNSPLKEGNYAVLEVKDDGVGIPPEFIDHIFEPFFTKKKMGKSGTGLGLSVVWYAVQDHKGHVEVKSEEGTGTTFLLYFPASGKSIAAAADEDMQPIRGKGEKILVVDDKKEQRDYASLLLSTLGYTVFSVDSGEKCIEFLRNESADLMLLDMIMDPGMDGLDTFREVKKIRPGQKAIIVSGFSETDRVKEAQELGAGCYVRKPYLMKTIARAIREELGR